MNIIEKQNLIKEIKDNAYYHTISSIYDLNWDRNLLYFIRQNLLPGSADHHVNKHDY